MSGVIGPGMALMRLELPGSGDQERVHKLS